MHGAMVAAGVEVTQAETRMHFHICRRGQSFEHGFGTSGVDHVHVCYCFILRVLSGKQGYVHSTFLSHQCHHPPLFCIFLATTRPCFSRCSRSLHQALLALCILSSRLSCISPSQLKIGVFTQAAEHAPFGAWTPTRQRAHWSRALR